MIHRLTECLFMVSVLTLTGLVVNRGRGERIRRFIVHAFALLLLAPASCLGANWFVRPTAQGAASGVDWNNATTLSGIPWASIATSDTIFIAGGTYSGQNFTPTKNGASAANPITLQRAQASNGACTSVAGWSSAFDSQVLISGGGFMRINFSFISVKGMVTSGIKISVPSGAGNYGIGVADGSSSTCTNVFLSYIEIAGPGSGAPLSYGLYSSATSHTSKETMDHMIVHDVVNGHQCYGRDNFVVQYCEVYNINGGSDGSHPNRFYLGSGTFTACVFQFNKFHDDNTLGCAYEDSGVCVSNVYAGNWFWNCAAVQGGITTDSDPGDAITSLYVYNNTFSNCCAGGAAVFIKKAWQAGAAQNNIVFKCGGMWQVVGGGGFGTTSIDHNFTDAASGDGGTGTITSGSDPFIGATDFHIVSTIAATFPRNKGTSAPGSNWNTDMDGNVRGADGAWDIGAQEFPSGGPDPNITTQPSATTVNCGNTASFSVVATGNTTLSYQWYKSGAAVSGATQSSYTTPATAGTDNGSLWKVVVTDAAGSVTSSVVALNIELIITQPANQTVAVNQTATFTITATTCVTSGGTYQWNRNGTSIAGATLSNYVLANCQLSDSGSTFSCNVGTVGESEGSASALLTVTARTNFYVSPTGNDSNNGLTTGTPWLTPNYAVNHVGNSNTLNFMAGSYATGTATTLTNSGVWLVSYPTKWTAVFHDQAGTLFDTTPGVCHFTIFDGLQFTNCQFHGIVIRQGISNAIVRNCWFQRTGAYGWAASQSSSGVETLSAYNTLIERNLVEYNGNEAGFDHGIYLGGTNCIVRNNVCRYNAAYGIQWQNTSPNDLPQSCQTYNNLCYGNSNGPIVIYNNTGTVGTNVVFGNTFQQGATVAGSSGFALDFQCAGTLQVTNNILISTNNAIIGNNNGGTVQSDYNLVSHATAFPGTHDVVNTAYGFVQSGNGLYWLQSSSPARGMQLSGVAGAVDFFNNSQSSVAAVGAFQYAGNLANDTRILDPDSLAPGGFADYWGQPAGVPLNLQILGQVKLVGNMVLK